MFDFEGQEVHHWHRGDDDAWLLLCNAAFCVAPGRGLDMEAVDVDPIFWWLLDEGQLVGEREALRILDVVVCRVPESHEVELELQEVYCFLVLPGKSLQDAGQEAVGEEEAAEPVGFWVTFRHPLPHEVHSFMQIFEPACQRLQARVRNCGPVGRYLVGE